MNLTEAINKRKEMEAKVTQKAMEDSDFRVKLFEAPRAALEEVVGKALPDNLSVDIVKEKPNTITIAVPEALAEDGELSDDMLDYVSGAGIGVALIITK